MPLKRKPITEAATQSLSLSSDDDDNFDLGLLDDALSSDEDSDGYSNDAESESGNNSDDPEESEDDDPTNGDLISKDSKITSNGTNGTKPESLLSDISSESSDSHVVVLDAEGNPRNLLPDIDPHYDSDSSISSQINTIGNIDIEKYYPASMPHIGYDINGRRIMRPAAGAALDQFLETIDLPKGWTGIIDKETGQLKNLTHEELEIIKRIRRQELPNEEIEIYDVKSSQFMQTLILSHIVSRKKIPFHYPLHRNQSVVSSPPNTKPSAS
jgi:ribosome biogenesis protein ERB1